MPSMVWNYLRVRGEYSFRGKNVVSGLELPPRARRIQPSQGWGSGKNGTTSAYAENTPRPERRKSECWNYLRVRGEYEHDGDFFVNHPELPPRTRRILQLDNIPTVPLGTTSAYAENTGIIRVIVSPRRNYLRVRGEYWDYQGDCEPQAELPPRTRRIQVFPIIFTPHLWNYLRVRGEYWTALRAETLDGELPPRTRRIHASAVAVWSGCGTTSAYAENTSGTGTCPPWVRNYLRVRGEYSRPTKSVGAPWELPPRTRRILSCVCGVPLALGTTSAYAENTLWTRTTHNAHRNYLRVRGEYRKALGGANVLCELPPRTRRIRTSPKFFSFARGTTSAYAENTSP